MRKWFILSVIAVLSVASIVWADATITATSKARTASLANGIEQVVGIGGLQSGNAVVVDSRGAMSVAEYPKTITSSTGATLNAGEALVGSACRLASVTCSGVATSAGDYVLIYDAASATGTPKIECTVGTAKDTNHVIVPGGATFSTGVFADSNSDAVFVTVTYDQ